MVSLYHIIESQLHSTTSWPVNDLCNTIVREKGFGTVVKRTSSKNSAKLAAHLLRCQTATPAGGPVVFDRLDDPHPHGICLWDGTGQGLTCSWVIFEDHRSARHGEIQKVVPLRNPGFWNSKHSWFLNGNSDFNRNMMHVHVSVCIFLPMFVLPLVLSLSMIIWLWCGTNKCI